MIRIFATVVITLCCLPAFAQSKTEKEEGGPAAASVVLHSDPRLALVTAYYEAPKIVYTGSGGSNAFGSIHSGKGYRVMIYSGTDRNKANAAKADFMRRYPGIRVYMTYSLPQYRIKVGDYTSRQEAAQFYRQLSSLYSPCMVVPDIVEINTFRKMIDRIRETAEGLLPEWQRIRRHIHAHPELSFREFETAAFVAAELDRMGIAYTSGIAGTGIVAIIEGKNPGKKCLAIRAELDALPIKELNDTPYTSQNAGIMHACGHDAHTACLLGTARIMQELREEWEGTLKLIFQPGEEMHPGGGSLMIADKVLEAPKVDAILALHVYPHLPAGVVGFRQGQYMASTDEIHITIEGKGGHAALPHQTIDPIAIAAQVIVSLQQVVSRRSNPISPSVLSFGCISGGTVNNVIPDQVTFAGTLRTMDEQWRAEAHVLIENIVTNTCAAFGAKATIDIPKGYPSLYNDASLTAFVESCAKEYLGAAQVRQLSLRMTADDFAFYSQVIPGCYFRLGTNTNNEQHTVSVHNAHFDIDERALATGTGLMSYAAYTYLNA